MPKPKPDHNLIEAEVKSLRGEIRGTWPAHDLPYELYHYTSAAGLLGILTSKVFWATDINFLNDATELEYASVLNNVLLDAKIAGTTDAAVKEFLTESKLFLSLHPSTMDAYVICFCEDGNLLSQWRAYGVSGSGYSIGVIAKSLIGHERRGAGAPVLETRLRKIVYTRSVQEKLVTGTLDHFCDLLLRTLEGTDNDYHSSITNIFANYLAAELSEYFYFFKSEVFEEEQEWRVIHTAMNYRSFDETDEKTKFRASGRNVIPYVELNFSEATQPLVARGYPISSIRFGPSLDPQLTQRSLYTLLNSTLGRGNGVRVSSSDIPLRTITS